MNQKLLKYMFCESGQNLLFYFLKPSNFMHYFFPTHMNQKSGFEIVDYITRLCVKHEIKISLSGIQLYALLNKKIFHPYNSFIEMTIFSDQENVSNTRNVLAEKFKNLLYFQELGVLLICPDNVCNEIGGSYFIIIIYICILNKSDNNYHYMCNDFSSTQIFKNQNELIQLIDFNNKYIFSVYFDACEIWKVPNEEIPNKINDDEIDKLNICSLLKYIH
jgi:hypothetical protein